MAERHLSLIGGTTIDQHGQSANYGGPGGTGGGMDDIGQLKADVVELKVDVSSIKATLPHLATKSDVSDAQTRIIQWVVGTTLTAGALAFAIAKFIH